MRTSSTVIGLAMAPVILLAAGVARAGAVVSKKCQPVLAGAWLATDGDVGIALASILDEPLKLPILFDATNQRLQRGSRIYLLNEEERSFLGTFDPDEPTLTLDLPSLGLCLMEITMPSTPLPE